MNPHFIRRPLIAAAMAAAALATAGHSAFAQPGDYPNKPIRMVVAFPPGGGVDILARLIGQRLQEQMGQTVIVENRPGANGNLATEAVAKSGSADGYTLLISGNGLATNPALYPTANYNMLRDLAPVAFVGYAPLMLVVPAASPFKNVKELIAQAKSAPGRVTYASAGNGSAAHLSTELLKSTAHVDILHVPYKGGPPAIMDLVGDRVSMMLLDPGQAMPQVKSQKLRVIAVSSAKRAPVLPDVPTIAEAGYPKFEATVWWGIVAPAKTPPEIVARLNTEINKAIAHPPVQARLAEISVVTEAMSPQEFGAYLRNEIDKWAAVVKAGGLKGE
jgi:tripartite-type tricarboxylate transporter receptor subunit TctC